MVSCGNSKYHRSVKLIKLLEAGSWFLEAGFWFLVSATAVNSDIRKEVSTNSSSRNK